MPISSLLNWFGNWITWPRNILEMIFEALQSDGLFQFEMIFEALQSDIIWFAVILQILYTATVGFVVFFPNKLGARPWKSVFVSCIICLIYNWFWFDCLIYNWFWFDRLIDRCLSCGYGYGPMIYDICSQNMSGGYLRLIGGH